MLLEKSERRIFSRIDTSVTRRDWPRQYICPQHTQRYAVTHGMNGIMLYMDIVPNENVASTGNTKGKIVLVSIVGAVAGVLIGAGTMAFLFQDALFFNIPAMMNIDAPPYPDQKTPDSKTNITFQIPEKLVGGNYNPLVTKIVNGLNQVGINNNATLLPLFKTIQQKSTARDFNGIFDLIIQARGEIKKNNDLLAAALEDIAALKKVNDETVRDADIRRQTAIFLTSAGTFVQAYTDYFATLNETLSGSIPTQALLDKLTGQITSLRDAGSSFRLELNNLLAIIQQKNKTSAQ